MVKTDFFFRESEEWLVGSIFFNEEYRLPVSNFNPKLILDCGGNIGCSAVYFANKFPQAQIYVVEPQSTNFKFLSKNVSPYANIHPYNSGLWDKETFIRVEDRGYGDAGFMTVETEADDPGAFRTVTVSKLLQMSGLDEIDLLKIDIEGAEKEVFSAPDIDEWLPKVKILTIELHDRMKLGCTRALFNAISRYDFYSALRTENLIFIRENSINKIHLYNGYTEVELK